MNSDDKVSRRTILTAAGIGTASMVAPGCASKPQAQTAKPSIKFDNADFYDADGKFIEQAGKDAYMAVMKYHGYPVFPQMQEDIWVSDYGTGKFTELGLGALFIVNNEEHHYMMLEIYLLPNQMLPEHYHLPTEKNPAKLEGWVCRHGLSYVYGGGEPTPDMHAKVPQCHMDGKVTVSHETILKPGMFVGLTEAGERHWQFGGPEGAILTEVANVHDGEGVRHSDETLVFA